MLVDYNCVFTAQLSGFDIQNRCLFVEGRRAKQQCQPWPSVEHQRRFADASNNKEVDLCLRAIV